MTDPKDLKLYINQLSQASENYGRYLAQARGFRQTAMKEKARRTAFQYAEMAKELEKKIDIILTRLNLL